MVKQIIRIKLKAVAIKNKIPPPNYSAAEPLSAFIKVFVFYKIFLLLVLIIKFYFLFLKIATTAIASIAITPVPERLVLQLLSSVELSAL